MSIIISYFCMGQNRWFRMHLWDTTIARLNDQNPKSKQSEIRNLKSTIESLIPKPILVPTIRTLPGDGIAGHPPYVFCHTRLTDIKPAPAPPAKAEFLTAAVAGKAG